MKLGFPFCAYPKSLLYKAKLLEELNTYYPERKEEQVAFSIQKLKVRVYKPVFYIRVLLMIASFFALSVGSGIIAIPIIALAEWLGKAGTLFLSLAAMFFCVFLGRIFTIRQKHIESGVDDALAFQALASAAIAWWALLELAHINMWSLWAILGGIGIAVTFSVFYIQRVFGFAAYCIALLLIVWFVDYFKIDKMSLPFVGFTLSAFTYGFFARMRSKSWYFYQPLFSFIRQLSLLLALLNFQPNVADLLWKLLMEQTTPFPLYGVFTVIFLCLTVGYLLVGWKKADVELVRIGILGLLIALWSILNAAFVAIEFQLVLGGAFFGLGAYFTIKAIEKGQLTRFGFRKTDVGDLEIILSQIVAEASKPAISAPAAQNNVELGGGDFGGAGASGNY